MNQITNWDSNYPYTLKYGQMIGSILKTPPYEIQKALQKIFLAKILNTSFAYLISLGVNWFYEETI
jgi:hypothetical protein